MKNNLGVYLGLCITYMLLLSAVTERETFYRHSQDTAAGEERAMPTSFSGITLDKENNITKQDFTHILPTSWQSFCKVEFKLIGGSNFSSRHAFEVSCHPQQGDFWSLQSYRDWITSFKRTFYRYIPNNRQLAFAFLFQCSHSSAKISLPFPVKALHLWYMSIDNCTITDQLLEYNVHHGDIPDTLGVLQITNSNFTLDTEQFFRKTRNYRNTSRDFYCGSEIMEKFVMRNNSKRFINMRPPELNLALITPLDGSKSREDGNNRRNTSTSLSKRLEPKNESEMNDIFAKFTQDHLKISYRCSHRKLRYLEESYQKMMSRHHSHFMLENARYPELRYFNMSRSGIVNMGPHMLDWRRYFPKMKYMDLSYNRIKYFSSLTDNGMSTDTGGILDLRHNNITSLTPDDLEALRLHSRTVFVDIRNNPIVCDCKLKTVVELLNNKTYQGKLDKRYEYLSELKCAIPARHKGKMIASLEKEFCEYLEYIILSMPLVVVSSVSVVLLAVFIVTVRYRKEIMILAFTRLHISLPCRKVSKSNDKKYDAFIAYSEQDSHWVFHTLLPRLEDAQENNGPGLKLCIHHRDFPIGGAISDNILDKVKQSRHTVLILSNNFLRSHWCKYEFRAAFTQSLMEKKQHLIMVLQEELDKTLVEKTLQRCLKTFTYVKAEDKLFWDKLIYALSDREKHTRSSSRYSCKYISNSSSEPGSVASNGKTCMSSSLTTPISNVSKYPTKSNGYLKSSVVTVKSKYSPSLLIRKGNPSKCNLNATQIGRQSDVSIISSPSLNAQMKVVSNESDNIMDTVNGFMRCVSIESKASMDTVDGHMSSVSKKSNNSNESVNGNISCVSTRSYNSMDTEDGHTSSASNESDDSMGTVNGKVSLGSTGSYTSMDTVNGNMSSLSNESDISMDTDTSALQVNASNLSNEEVEMLYSSVDKYNYASKSIEVDDTPRYHSHEMEKNFKMGSDVVDLSDIIDYYSSDNNSESPLKESRVMLDDTTIYNDRSDSLIDTMSPWIKSWFSGRTESNMQENGNMESINDIAKGSNHC